MLAAIIASTDDVIISKTLVGIITSWNPAAERTFGYTEKEALGQHISLIIPPERLEEETFIIGKITNGEKSTILRRSGVRRTGVQYRSPSPFRRSGIAMDR